MGPGPPVDLQQWRMHMDKAELLKLQTYFRRLFGNTNIKVVARPKKTDSAEVMIGDEFIGIISLDTEDGDRSFAFTMSILDIDLEGID
jgi:Protein of unknown function (DUF3126)